MRDSQAVDIAVLKTKLDQIHEELHDHKKQSEKRSQEIIKLVKEQNGRIKVLEIFKYRLVGGAALVGVIWAVVTKLI